VQGTEFFDNSFFARRLNFFSSRWMEECISHTVATDHQSVKLGKMWGNHNSDMGYSASKLLWWGDKATTEPSVDPQQANAE